MSNLDSVLVDPLDVGTDAGVDSRVVGEGAGLSPGDDTDLFSVDGQWAAGVTVAGSLLGGRVVGTDLGRIDVVVHLPVHVLAVSLVSDVDVHTLELVGRWATLPEPAPSRNNGDFTTLGNILGSRQTDEGYVSTSDEWSFDLKEGDVVDPGVSGVVVFVDDDFGDVVFRSELRALQVNSTGYGFNLGCRLAGDAVSSGEDVVFVQDGTTTEVEEHIDILEGDLVRDFAGLGIFTVDDSWVVQQDASVGERENSEER